MHVHILSKSNNRTTFIVKLADKPTKFLTHPTCLTIFEMGQELSLAAVLWNNGYSLIRNFNISRIL